MNHGSWQLRDEHNYLVAKGTCEADQPHGRWTTYHANGRKAADGQMIHGIRTGVWRTWNERGQRESEVTYAISKREWPYGSSVWSYDIALPSPQHIGKSQIAEESIRQGPSRLWHPSGTLKSQGAYAQDFREGPWAFYDDRGRLLERGNYHRGLREGPWEVVYPDTGKTTLVHFESDWKQEELSRLKSELQVELSSDDLLRQITAMHRIEDLGRAGSGLLVKLLDAKSDDLKLMALRRLARLATSTESVEGPIPGFDKPTSTAQLRLLTESSDTRLANLAMLWLFRDSPPDRDALYLRLIAAARQTRDEQWKQCALAVLYITDESRHLAIFAELAHAEDSWRPPFANGMGSNQGSPYPWIALQRNNVEAVVKPAMLSTDARVRLFALRVIHAIVVRSPPREETLPDGGKRMRYPIPDVYRELIERAKLDPEQSVRTAAEAVDLADPPDLPHGAVIPVVG
jgi:hypothetical protein